MIMMSFTTEDAIKEKINKARKISKKYGNVSFALGYAYQNDSSDITEALKLADQRMYEDKAKYYLDHPEYMR